jgi:hypothetical protein
MMCGHQRGTRDAIALDPKDCRTICELGRHSAIRDLTRQDAQPHAAQQGRSEDTLCVVCVAVLWCLFMAHRDRPSRRSNSDAIGGIADIGRRSAPAACDAIGRDPG